MDNYKIKVKDEAENVDIQNAFFALGYGWSKDRKKEITTSQDMIDDGYSSNYKIAFIYAGNDGHLLNGDDSADGYRSFVESDAKEITLPELLELAAAKQPQDPALISGADAHKALLAGENVQYSGDGGEEHWDTALNCNIGVFLNQEKFPNFKFRIAPRTIKVNSELPKPAREFQLNTEVFAVTYEFKTREERNAFADKLRGTNS